MGLAAPNDEAFGPQYGSLIDFTLVLDNVIFSVVPVALIVAATPFHATYHNHEPLVGHQKTLLWVKMVIAAILILLEVCMSIVWSQTPDLFSTSTKGATSIAVIAACSIAFMMAIEHRRVKQSSPILSVYLSIMLVADAIRASSFLLRSSLHMVGVVSFTICIVKLILLIMLEMPTKDDSTSTSHDIPCEESNLNADVTTGFWTRNLTSWMNSPILVGFHRLLSPLDLDQFGPDFAASRLSADFTSNWAKTDKKSEFCLPIAWFNTLGRSFLIPAIPRVCQTIFSFSLPPLMKQILKYLQLDPEEQLLVLPSTKTGYVLSFAVVYLGVAISKASHSHLIGRHATLLGTLLKGQIMKKNLRLEQSDTERGAALTLMSSDVDGIILSMETFHSTWIAVPELGIALYLLYNIIDMAFLLPIIPIFISVVASNVLMNRMAPASVKWNGAIQDRVSTTAKVLSQMKAIKMIGLEPVITNYIQGLRERELDLSLDARKVDIARRSLFPLAYGFTPLITIAGALFWTTFKDGLNAVTVFVLVAYLYLMYEPLYSILNSWTDIGVAMGSFDRVQEFLLRSEHEDPRDIKKKRPAKGQDSHNQPDETTLVHDGHSSLNSEYISFLDTTVKSTSSNNHVLQHLNMEIRRASLVMVIGPVGSGKTAFLKTLIGEASFVRGKLFTHRENMAFCAQRPWLPNLSVRQSVIGNSAFDAAWYTEVIAACSLDRDIQNLAEGDKTLIGSSGATLSGGQKQRVALARAVYSRAPVLVLDDVFSSFDAEKSLHIFTSLLGAAGILTEQKRTIIMATHTYDYLAYADDIYVLDGRGNMMRRPLEAVAHLIPPFHAEPNQNDAAVPSLQVPLGEVTNMQRALKEAIPKATDSSLYPIFLQPLSKPLLTVSAVLICLVGMLERMPDILLRFWVAGDSTNPIFFSGLVGIAFAAVFINYIAARLYMIKIVPLIANELHSLFVRSFMASTLPFITSTGIGALMHRSSQDMSIISQALPMALYRVVYSGASVLTDTAVIIFGAYFAFLIFPVVGFCVYFVQSFYLRTSRKLRLMDSEARTPLFTKLAETMAGLEHIRSYGWQEKTLDESFKLLDASQKPLYHMLSLQRWLVLMLDLNIAIIGVWLILIAVYWPTATSPQSLGLALVVTIGHSQGITYLANQWTTLESSLGAILRLRTFVNETPVEKDKPNAQERHDKWIKGGEVKFDNITAAYSFSENAPTVLQEVSFTARPGDRVAVTGRSGSGKSSLILCCLNFLDYIGSIHIDGVDISSIPRHQLRKLITTIPQDTVDIPGSVYDNLLPLEIMNAKQPDEEKDKQAKAALTKVGLLYHVEGHGGIHAPIEDMEFSAGQQQLLGLARALLHHDESESKIVLMDEPTSNIDYDTETIMRHVMDEAFSKCTRLIVTYRPVSYRECDYLVSLADGGVLYTIDMAKQRVEEEDVEKELQERRRAVETWMDGTSDELSSQDPGPSSSTADYSGLAYEGHAVVADIADSGEASSYDYDLEKDSDDDDDDY